MMRDLTHPVAVIVAQSKDSSHPTGLLVSSFNTVTLEPVPHVSFNLKLPSSTYDEMKKSKAFTASAITRVQIAREFLLDKTDPRHAIAFRSNVNNHGNGKLSQEKGAIWWMRCQWLEDKSVQVGDHVVVIGEVISAGFYKVQNMHGRIVDKPLLYGQGQFRYAGPQIS
ncbi:MAG: hypothetical protein L6R37_003382 [Teloschistes peruensis]|nr:MAG: hypothetical protein L6R37_003382 [Teloschistes peruensis]